MKKYRPLFMMVMLSILFVSCKGPNEKSPTVLTIPTIVTTVSVGPSETIAIKGESYQFTVSVNGLNQPQTVTWRVEGNTSGGSTINSSGLLTVAINETTHTLKVIATSTSDTTKSGRTEVFVYDETPRFDGFETGNFSAMSWNVGSWTIVTTSPASGHYCAQSYSGYNYNNSRSTLQITWPFSTGGTITFDYKVSSEANFDFLEFTIDNAKGGRWSGTSETNWRTATYSVPIGNSVILKWTYTKDGSISSGADRAWIDNVRFTP